MTTIKSLPRSGAGQTRDHVLTLTRIYKWLLLIAVSMLPLTGIVYLSLFQEPPLRFVSLAFHEAAITASIIASGFVTFVTLRCYLSSGEPFLRWITVGLLGFTIIYAPHGFLTRHADHNLWLFLLYGPASRLVMAGCFFMGLLKYGKPADPPEQRRRQAFWWKCLGLFILINGLVAVIANSPVAGHPAVRMTMEVTALAVSLVAIATILARRITSPLMLVYAIALACFAQSSIAFLYSLVWTHLWWYAHAIFVGGFFLLSYGIVQAFHTTRSFISVYSQEELMNNLRAEKARTEEALCQIREGNRKNEILISELRETMAKVRTLSGFIPICASCKMIRDDQGYWNQIEAYLQEHTEASFSHGICPTCTENLYGQEEWYKQES